MPRLIIPILLLLPTLACGVPTKNVLIGNVIKVQDGDTITILTADHQEERIRLWGIDAPEKRGGQPFWQASRDQLAQLVAGKTVTVTWDQRGRNGRTLGRVMVEEGQWVNLGCGSPRLSLWLVAISVMGRINRGFFLVGGNFQAGSGFVR